jgi:glutathione S-transferase
VGAEFGKGALTWRYPRSSAQREKFPVMNARLVGSKLCPFLQRIVITFHEKQLPFELEHIDVAKKPAWFLALSPLGRHPLLQVEGHVLFESTAIVELVEESGGPALLPADRYLRAENRAFIEAASEAFRALFAMVGAKDASTHDAAVQQLRAKLEPFEARLQGPWFNGAELSLVDAAMAPLLQRITWLDELGHSRGVLQERPKLVAWRDALLSRPSVAASSHPEARAWCAALPLPRQRAASA